VSKPTAAYIVTHSYATDSDPAKVLATLHFWEDALAERVLVKFRPIARFILPIRQSTRGRKRTSTPASETIGR
jgi:hypothetical protein